MRFRVSVCIAVLASVTGNALAQNGDNRAHERLWTCRLVVRPTLLGVIERAWPRSESLQRQCRELADVRAVVELEWGRRTDSERRAVTRMKTMADGVVVAHVSVPPEGEVIELVAHELEHVIERAQGLDYAAAAKRPDSGVWETRGTYETQRAIDAGRQVAKEVECGPMRRPVVGRCEMRRVP